MKPDDVRLTAQLVVDRRVHAVSDEAVEAMARRVLELEQHEAALAQSLDQMVELVGEAQSQRNANHQKAAEEATLRARAEADLADAKAAEREACAKLVEEWRTSSSELGRIATAIRARGAR